MANPYQLIETNMIANMSLLAGHHADCKIISCGTTGHDMTYLLHPAWVGHLPAAINWNGYQVTHEQCKSNGQWCKHLQTHWSAIRVNMDTGGERAHAAFDVLWLLGLLSSASSLSKPETLPVLKCKQFVMVLKCMQFVMLWDDKVDH